MINTNNGATQYSLDAALNRNHLSVEKTISE